MKRNDFLKNLALAGGGLVFIGCERQALNDLFDDTQLDEIGIEDAKSWFYEYYLKPFKASRISGNEKSYKRKTNWNKALKLKDNKNQDFVCVPVEYETEDVPGIIFFDDATAYRQKMRKESVHPIVEYLIVTKVNKTNKAFLAQIAYDPFALSSDKTFTFATFTGWLMKADWDDKITAGSYYRKGKKFVEFDTEKQRGGKLQNGCTPMTFEYQTVTTNSCGPNCTDVTVTLHRSTYCIPSINPYTEPDATYVYNPYYDPYNLGSAGGSGLISSNTLSNYFNVKRAVCISGGDRQQMNEAYSNALYATGLSINSLDWSLDKAEAAARSIGAELKTYQGLLDGVGYAGMAIDGIQLVVGYWGEDRPWGTDDWLNAAQLALGVVGFFAGGWVAVGLGGLSIGIAVYAQTLDNQPACP